MVWREDEYFIKAIRSDKLDFFREFILQCTQTARQQSIFPLRHEFRNFLEMH